MSETITSLPMIPVRGLTLLPTMVVHFDISRERSKKAVEKAMANDQMIYLVTQRNPDDDDPGLQDLYVNGVIAKICNVAKLPKDIIRVMVEGINKAKIHTMEKTEGYLSASVEVVAWDRPDFTDTVADGMTRAMEDLVTRYAQSDTKFSKEVVRKLLEQKNLEKITMGAAIQLPLDYQLRQTLLDTESFMEFYDGLCTIIVNEIQAIDVRNEIQDKVKARIDKGQREYILREQIKVIQEELGEDSLTSDIKKFEEDTQNLEASQEVKDKISKEIKRLRTLGNNSAESAVVRTYIETMLEMPWNKMSQDDNDLKKARKILDEDHYGLEKVKERVLEFLAVRTLNKKGDSPIICLAGPPGTGKTSIARSVAESLGKKYVRISLGGVHDEAEIRGHRKTYVGAMPGRIAAGMQLAGVKNPLMLLDEIDKVSSDYKGDTSSALLEVLDSEQNCRFRDHYIEVPIDLSEVLFIATANDLHTIPRPLLDRMEIIEVSSYTSNEKLHIAKDHLLKKQLEKNGLTKNQLTITKGAMQAIIEGYTRESGVRQLERKIGEVCRKAAKEILEGEKDKIRVSAKNLEHYLGRRKLNAKKKNNKDEVGIVRGLAWTSAGGDTLQIEVNTMPGKGEFVLTGQMGDVMKESARTAISYVRSIAKQYQVEDEFFQKNDIHIHIPEGAVPKDGPSAGITMATAILSAASGIPVKADLAMTGEITLRGRALAIGGLKEKLLAAKQAGISKVLVPEENEADVMELNAEITDGLEIVFVSAMPEVLEHALKGGVSNGN